MDAFDADVLIYAASGDGRGDVVAEQLARVDSRDMCTGSTLLIPEVLSHPLSRGDTVTQKSLELVLSRLRLRPVDIEVAALATTMRVKYRLKTPDAVHLATAVLWGADRFHTNNSKDFGQYIDEIEIVLPGRG
jgi:uncharacterized protein